jgi:protein tyrosine phosphatase type IVA
MTTVIMRQKDIRPAPARIEFKGMKFLITDRPSDVTIHTYIMVSNLTKKKHYFCL